MTEAALALYGWVSMPSKLTVALDRDVNIPDVGCGRAHRRGSFEGGEDTGYRDIVSLTCISLIVYLYCAFGNIYERSATCAFSYWS